MARTRRRLELVQAALNRGGKPDWQEIEGTVELEFLAWEAKVREAAARVAAAEHRLAHLLSDEEGREVKKLYYALVKMLHPDLNPVLTEEQRRLWLRVQSAYESGDLQELRALTLLAQQGGPVSTAPAHLEKLRQDRATLAQQITVLLRRMEQLESQPPFTMRRQLADEAWWRPGGRSSNSKFPGWTPSAWRWRLIGTSCWPLWTMEKSLALIEPSLLALMHGAFGQDGALMPFAREIMLIECQIAGTTHREVKELEPALRPGSLLPLQREPANGHDPLAVMIFDEDGHHLGYVPRAKNEAIARLMDAGKLLFARLETKEWRGEWLRAEVRVFLRDF